MPARLVEEGDEAGLLVAKDAPQEAGSHVRGVFSGTGRTRCTLLTWVQDWLHGFTANFLER